MFHRSFKHSKTIKALGLRPRAFISFLVFETPMKHSHSFLKYYFKSTVNNLLFSFSQTQLSISSFHIDHKWTLTFLTVTGIFIPRSWPFGNLIGFRCMLIGRPSRYARQCCERNSFSLERFAVFISVDLKEAQMSHSFVPLRNLFE